VPWLLLPLHGGDEAPGGALQRALAVPDEAGLRADVRFLSDDVLHGRDTPSDGLRVAARFLRARLERLGWLPAGDEGFLATYVWRHASLDLEHTHAAFVRPGRAPDVLVFGEDYYFPSSGLADQRLEAPLVAVGRGSAEGLAGVELEGRVALAVGVHEQDWAALQEEVRLRGAAGLLVAPFTEERGVTERLAARARGQAEEGQLQTAPDPLPTAFLTARGLERLGLPEGTRAGDALSARFRDVRALGTGAGEPLVLENVVGLLPGSDPALSREVLLVTAHYDHLGARGDLVYHGAYDNASGTSALLALAEALVEHGPLRRSVCLLWLAGEEHGMQGSWAWASRPTLPAGLEVTCDLNLDMVGRNAPGELHVTPSRAHPRYNHVVEVLERCAPAEGFPRLLAGDDQWDRSDHRPFALVLGIPVASLSTGEHEDYHRTSDTWDKIDYDKLRRVTRLVLRALVELDAEPVVAGPVEASASR